MATSAQELPEEDPQQKASVRLTLGAGIAYVPRYPGADEYRLRGIPVFGVGAGIRIDRSWNIGTRIATSRLEGDAGPSPITRDRNQHLAALFASYRF